MNAAAIEAHRQRCARQVAVLRRRACDHVMGGRQTAREELQLQRCRIVDTATRTVVLYTRDGGMHSSGWLRNPDYERCYHLSLSPFPTDVDPGGQPLIEHRAEVEAFWVDLFFGERKRWTVFEGPKSPEGRRIGVVHWRLFADARWVPFQPRAEVYSSLFTPRGWLSWQEAHALHGGPIIESHLFPG